MKKLLAAGAVFCLSACSTATVQRDAAIVNAGASAVQAGCAEALPLAGAAVALPVVGLYVAPGVQAACTGAGLVKLASDPSSAEWLGKQSQMLRDALAKAKG